MMTQPQPDVNVVNQRLRGFTVQIRADDDEILGTGVVVDVAGKVVTCAHVAQAALGGTHPREAGERQVGVYFPQRTVREDEKRRRAIVKGVFPQHDDDVVLLELTEGPAPLGPEYAAKVGKCDQSAGHPFRSYGYRRLDKYNAAYAWGDIGGEIESPEEEILHAEPIQLDSPHINLGMSGAAVLDVERNLVVGVISQKWYPDESGSDANTAFGVNARVLSLEPLNLPLMEEDLPRTPAPQPRIETPQDARPQSGYDLSRAPEVLEEWVGRDDLRRKIRDDYASPQTLVIALVGFGGEGKTSLARKALDEIISQAPDSPSPSDREISPPPASPSPRVERGPGGEVKPDGVFWWSFYERRSSDEFFEAALTYVGGAEIAARTRSAGARAEIIAALLKERRTIFVLDGFEVMQHDTGDQYGAIANDDLRDFLQLFAAPGHTSLCLITSRAPLLDLIDFTTFRQHSVERLGSEDGRDLLRQYDARGTDADLNRIVSDWDGHALTVSLIGAYLREVHNGDATAYTPDLFPKLSDYEEKLERHQQVSRILARYDTHLTDAERAFLKLFSLFRLPVKADAIDKIFRGKREVSYEKQPGRLGKLLGQKPQTVTEIKTEETYWLVKPVAALSDADFASLLTNLIDRRMIRQVVTEDGATAYTAHPLVRAHYSAALSDAGAHREVADYYQENAGDVPRFPTLDDLAPYIEVVHHLCRAGAYDEAHQIRAERIYQYDRLIIMHILGAYETSLALFREFFPGSDLTGNPAVSNPAARSFILNEVGFCLMSLGRLDEAPPFYERHNEMAAEREDWRNASVGYQNLAGLYIYLGALDRGAAAAGDALAYARRMDEGRERQTMERSSLAWLAWLHHLRGRAAEDRPTDVADDNAIPEASLTAAELFGRAEALERKLYFSDLRVETLFSYRGVRHADHLRRTGDPDYARRVAEANVETCKRNGWAGVLSMSRRNLGDLDADAGDHESARAHYDEALRLARGIQVRDVLIEALLGRGLWYAKHMKDHRAAFSDLNEALAYAETSGYRIYEADVRVALAWAHLRAGEPGRAREEAMRARSMSADMGYHWGQVDADEVLAEIG